MSSPSPSFPGRHRQHQATSSHEQCFTCPLNFWSSIIVPVFQLAVSFYIYIYMCVCVGIWPESIWKLLGTSPNHGAFVASSEVSPVTPGERHPSRGRVDLSKSRRYIIVHSWQVNQDRHFKDSYWILLNLMVYMDLWVFYFILEPRNQLASVKPDVGCSEYVVRRGTSNTSQGKAAKALWNFSCDCSWAAIQPLIFDAEAVSIVSTPSMIVHELQQRICQFIVCKLKHTVPRMLLNFKPLEPQTIAAGHFQKVVTAPVYMLIHLGNDLMLISTFPPAWRRDALHPKYCRSSPEFVWDLTKTVLETCEVGSR